MTLPIHILYANSPIHMDAPKNYDQPSVVNTIQKLSGNSNVCILSLEIRISPPPQLDLANSQSKTYRYIQDEQ